MPDSRSLSLHRGFPSGPRFASLQQIFGALGQFLGRLDAFAQCSLRVLDFGDVVDVFISHSPIPARADKPLIQIKGSTCPNGSMHLMGGLRTALEAARGELGVDH